MKTLKLDFYGVLIPQVSQCFYAPRVVCSDSLIVNTHFFIFVPRHMSI